MAAVGFHARLDSRLKLFLELPQPCSSIRLPIVFSTNVPKSFPLVASDFSTFQLLSSSPFKRSHSHGVFIDDDKAKEKESLETLILRKQMTGNSNISYETDLYVQLFLPLFCFNSLCKGAELNEMYDMFADYMSCLKFQLN